ncbi:hypothetical protein AB0M39_18490 [Streptomyces sp. NPDC051907]|uniref:hypothetical protein n=1 Tax=Streptomyces sp. NPDC051907 TaxID=3155284 RepID=UPI0034239156
MTTTPTPGLPPVTAEAAAQALDLLPARLRKRVDGAAAKARGWPVEPTAEGVRVRVDEDTTVTLKVTAGVVAQASDAVCDCLLAPACLHRAAILSNAPLAEESADAHRDDTAATEAEPQAQPEAEQEAEQEAQPEPDLAAPGTGPGRAEPAAAAPAPAASPAPLAPVAPSAPVASPAPAQLDSLQALQRAAVAVLVSGVAGAGPVHRAELLHAAHSARLAGLHRPSAVAVRVARQLGEARADDPAFRLPGLSADLAELLGLVRSPADAVAPARRAYEPAGPLRLYGLFTEPVVTASGYAGATAYALAPDGTLRTLSDIAPGGPERAAQAAASPVPGGCALALRAWGDGGGVILTGPTVSPDGRIGGGAKLRSVRAPGAQWHEPPLDALWQRSPAGQLAAALDWLTQPSDARPAGGDLLFLGGTVTEAGFWVDGGPTLRLLAPDERPELLYAENLRLLASRPGLRLRLIARAVPDRPGAVHALAAAWDGHDGDRVRADLGLARLNRTHIPKQPQPGRPTPVSAPRVPDQAPRDHVPTDQAPPVHSAPEPAPLVSAPAPQPALPVELDLLRRAVDRTVAGGRAVTAAGADGELPRRLRAAGLATGAKCARALAEAAADRRHDALGRLLPADPEAFAAAWLAAAVYASAASRSLLLAAWSPPEASHTRSGPTGTQP